jgi:nucleoid-associated protein YgaU
VAEFRKREDITQEIDLLQQWSELGAPRMGELAPSLNSLVKAVDPAMASKIEIRTQPAGPDGTPVPSELPGRIRDAQKPMSLEDAGWPPEGPPPPEFADLPPGDDERPSRGLVLPTIATLLLLAAVAALWLQKDPFVHAPGGPAATPGEPGVEPTLAPLPTAPVPATAAPEASPAATPTAMATAAPPSAAPSGVTSPDGTRATPGAGAATHAPAGAQRSPLPGLRPVKPVVRTKPKVTEYVVHLGDSLSLIAKRELGEMERWPELYELNRTAIADADLIHPGQKLALPAEAAPEAPAEVAYTTRPGDTLQRIAAAHLGDAGRWREIAARNRDRLPATSVLPPGTVLILPADASAGAGGAAPKPGYQARGKVRHHVVRHGESLSLLARRYLGATSRWPEIYYLNQHKIANPAWVYPGQVLAIPPAVGGGGLRYVVRSGDTLWAIAATRMGSPFRWPTLYRANRDRIADPHWIYPGQVFRVPG